MPRGFATPALLLLLLLSAACVAFADDASATVEWNLESSNVVTYVHTGGAVTWTVTDGVTHTVTQRVDISTGEAEGFGSGEFDNGNYTYMFMSAGVYAYACSIHDYMTGQVVVNSNDTAYEAIVYTAPDMPPELWGVKFIVWHAILMYLAFGVCIPLGYFLASWRSIGWHKNVQVTGLCVGLLGFVCAAVDGQTTGHFDRLHSVVGVGVLVLACFAQPLFVYLGRIATHKMNGQMIIWVGLMNTLLGIVSYNEEYGDEIWATAAIGISVGGVVIAFLLYQPYPSSFKRRGAGADAGYGAQEARALAGQWQARFLGGYQSIATDTGTGGLIQDHYGSLPAEGSSGSVASMRNVGGGGGVGQDTASSALLEATSECIVSADANGDVNAWSAGAEAMFGFTKEQIIGKSIELLMPSKYQLEHRRAYARAARQRYSDGVASLGSIYEVEGLTHAGVHFPIEIFVTTYSIDGAHCFVARIVDQRRVFNTRAITNRRWDFVAADAITEDQFRVRFCKAFGIDADAHTEVTHEQLGVAFREALLVSARGFSDADIDAMQHALLREVFAAPAAAATAANRHGHSHGHGHGAGTGSGRATLSNIDGIGGAEPAAAVPTVAAATTTSTTTSTTSTAGAAAAAAPLNKLDWGRCQRLFLKYGVEINAIGKLVASSTLADSDNAKNAIGIDDDDDAKPLLLRWLPRVDVVSLALAALYVFLNIALFFKWYLGEYEGQYAVGDLFKAASYDDKFFLFSVNAAGKKLTLINLALLPLPMLRSSLTYLRATRLNEYIRIDSSIAAHKLIGVVAFIATLIHVLFQLRAYEVLDVMERLHSTTEGATGVVLVLAFAVLYLGVLGLRRRGYFNVFFFTHHMYVIIFVVLFIHGVDSWNPGWWKVFLVPGTLYVIERFYRANRMKPLLHVERADVLSGDIVHIRMARPSNFAYKPGQYVFLCVPQLSRFEYHPFTLTSAPSEASLDVHIRACGDWTRRLYDLVQGDNFSPEVRIDGAYGSPSEHIFKYKTAVLVGAGIGTTPAASILKSIYARFQGQHGCSLPSCSCTCTCCNFKLEKIYFVWVTQDIVGFEWFAEYLSELQALDVNQFMECRMYLTGRHRQPDGAENRVLLQLGMQSAAADNEGVDLISGLRTITEFGRPDMDKLLRNIKKRHNGAHEVIGTFFCGPQALNRQLKRITRSLSQSTGTKFQYHYENF